MRNRIIGLLSVSVALLSCVSLASCAQEVIELGRDTSKVASEPDVVTMELAPLSFADATRTSVDLDEETGLVFSWSADDAVGVYSSEGGLTRFTIAGEAGASSALFDGQGFKLVPGHTYTAIYPYDGDRTSPGSIDMDYSSKTLNPATGLADLIGYDPLFASAQADEAGSADFSFHHVSSFVRLKCTFPQAGTYTSMKLVPTYGDITQTGSLNVADGTWSGKTGAHYDEIALDEVNVVSSSEEVSLWLPMAPQDFSGKDLAAFAYDDDDNLYSMRLEGKNFQSGKAYRWYGDMQKYSSTGSSQIEMEVLETTSISYMPSGEYSGITKVDDGRYAVVHDKEPGGGIIFFDLGFYSDGRIKSHSYSYPAGREEATDMRDPEGIAYFPDGLDGGTLFVSGEGDQRILEYDMDGRPTGRELEIPDDMATSMISGNSGFESLDYNAETELFWTTTEACLDADDRLGQDGMQLLRLQSFGSDLKAKERYFYLLDPPVKSPSGARNYAFGVPDILALDDGRLLVMEREAWIPNGDYSDILLKTVVYISIYEVDPVNDKGGILSKRPVTSFTISGGLSFANYEGICFGPVLGGKQTVLMLNDSQDRYGVSLGSYEIDVLQDYLKVLTIDY